jgi:hypothetical protein
MVQEFSKLRFKEFAKAAAAGAIVGALALQPIAADAATGSVVIHAGNATWFVNTNITFATTSSGGLAFSEATLQTASGSRSDAFDGVLTWLINPSPGTPPTVVTDPSQVYQSPGGTVDVTANSVIGTTQVMSGLNVHSELYFASSKAVVRSILFMQNPTGAPITVNVESGNNLGSDNNTLIVATSSGDSSFTFPTDHWWVSCQQSEGGCPPPGTPSPLSDPVLTFAISQANAPLQPASFEGPVTGNDRIYLHWPVTVPAGATVALMMFVQLSDTPAHAEADALLFNTTESMQASGYLAGLTQTQLAEILNFTVGAAPAPTLGEWAKIGMAGLLSLAGLFSFGFFRRRQRGAGAS